MCSNCKAVAALPDGAAIFTISAVKKTKKGKTGIKIKTDWADDVDPELAVRIIVEDILPVLGKAAGMGVFAGEIPVPEPAGKVAGDIFDLLAAPLRAKMAARN